LGSFAMPDAPVVPKPPFDLTKGKENSCKHLFESLESTKSVWVKMMSKATAPAVGTEMRLMFIADQDQASRVGEDAKWETKLASGVLKYHGDLGEGSYTLTAGPEARLYTRRGDKDGRGAEYSALELFDGKLLTMCDRTGNCDEIKITADGTLDIVPLVDAAGLPVAFRMGDGKKDKALKVEWATKKDGVLVVGSTGKERTDDDGNVVHEGEMWVKKLAASTYEIEHVDMRSFYNALRVAARCEQGAGYMIHEGGRWSDVHGAWLFMPRKLSRERYDEVVDAAKCVNLMLTCPDPPAPDGANVALGEYLEFCDLRGCSDFLFVPGSNDCHIFVIRTEETLEGVLSTYASVIDLEGKVLMPEAVFQTERKFEGVAEVTEAFWEALVKSAAAEGVTP
jgi:soluble calcium-activated nucleotidase 1